MDEDAGPFLNPESTAGEAPTPSPPSPKAGSFYERTDWQSFWLTTVLIFIIYLWTLCPSIELGDSGNFATGAMYAGVPDTPGFPLWTLYAHIFATLLPLSNVAWRVSVSSAIAAAVACGFIALMVSRGGALMLENPGNFTRLSPQREKWLRVVSGYAAGMSFGLTSCVWSHAVIVDWWPLSFALFAAVLCLLLRWSCAPEQTRFLFAAIFIYGLALTNSQSLIVAMPGLELFILFVRPALGRDFFAVTALLLIPVLWVAHGSVAASLWHVFVALTILCPVITVVLVIKTRRLLTEWQTVIGCFCLLALGLTLYFYCAIASMTNPPLNWGYPRTVEGFWHLVTRSQYERVYPVDDLSRYWQQTRLYWGIVASDYGRFYLLPAAIPFFLLHRMTPERRRWIFGILALFLCESAFLLGLLNPSSDAAARDLNRIYFAPSFLLLALWTGFGLVALGNLAMRPRRQRVVL
jgi:hypothetical protein